jgi:hypothetical protein
LHHHCIVQFISTLYTRLPNISKKSAAYQKKAKDAVRILEKTTGISVPQAMILAGFLKSDAANKIVHQVVRRCHQQKQGYVHGGQPAPTKGIILISNEEPSLLNVTDESPPSTTT